MLKSNSLLLEAVQLDPQNAEAWAMLAATYNEMINFFLMPREEGVPLTRNALDQAQQLAPDLAIVWGQDGFIKKNLHWDWNGARADLDKAYKMEPRHGAILTWRASLLGSMGKFDESVSLYEKKYSIDPLSLTTHSALGLAYTKVHRYDDAIRIFEKQLELSPNYHWAYSNMAKAYMFKGDKERALLEINKNAENVFKAAALPVVYHSLGRKAESDAALQAFLSEYGAGGHFFFIACVYSWRGEKDQAFEWLEKAYQAHDTGIAYMLGENLLDPLLDDPRWAAFLEKVNLLEHWKAMPAEYGGPQN